MSFLNAICPEQLVILATVISLVVSKDQSADKLNALGNFIVGVGGLILTIAAQMQYQQALQENMSKKDDLQQQVQQLQRQIHKLEKSLR